MWPKIVTYVGRGLTFVGALPGPIIPPDKLPDRIPSVNDVLGPPRALPPGFKPNYGLWDTFDNTPTTTPKTTPTGKPQPTRR